jgi:plastocyanin
MKKFIGLCILVILLVAASGCTQQAKPATTTPVPTEVVTAAVVTTEIPVTETTTMPPTVLETTVIPTANATEVMTVVSTTASPKTVNTPSTKITTIYIRNNTFVPTELTVLPGTGITWINDDKTVHSIRTLPQTKIMFNSMDVMPGASFGYTFGENEGTFGFIDTYTNATGMIIVKKGESVLGSPQISTPVPTTTKA